MNQHHQIKLIALLLAQWTSAGTREGKELGAGRAHYCIPLIARTCACTLDSAGNDKEQNWKHMGVFIHLSAHIEICNNGGGCASSRIARVPPSSRDPRVPLTSESRLWATSESLSGKENKNKPLKKKNPMRCATGGNALAANHGRFPARPAACLHLAEARAAGRGHGITLRSPCINNKVGTSRNVFFCICGFGHGLLAAL